MFFYFIAHKTKNIPCRQLINWQQQKHLSWEWYEVQKSIRNLLIFGYFLFSVSLRWRIFNFLYFFWIMMNYWLELCALSRSHYNQFQIFPTYIFLKNDWRKRENCQMSSLNMGWNHFFFDMTFFNLFYYIFVKLKNKEEIRNLSALFFSVYELCNDSDCGKKKVNWIVK